MAEQIDFQTHFDEESESLRRTLEEMRKEAEEEIMRLSSRLAERDYDPDSSVVTATERLALQQEMMVLQQTLEAKGQALDHITEECRRLEDELEDQHIVADGLKQEIERKDQELQEARKELERLRLQVEQLTQTLIAPPPPPPPVAPPKEKGRTRARGDGGSRIPGWLVGLLLLFIVLSVSMVALLYLVWGQIDTKLPALLQRTLSPPAATIAPPPEPIASTPAPQPTAARPAATRPPAPPPTQVRDRLRGGASGPALIRLAGGTFKMGNNSLSGEDFSPAHQVAVAPFLIGAYEVTYQDYDRFARATGRALPSDRGRGRGEQPVTGVSWDDAQAYADWLSRETGHPYRLPSEAEWEFAARAGTETSFWWGYGMEPGRAVCFDCGTPWDNRSPAPVGRFPANPFGLYDTSGNVMEWVEDCYLPGYQGAPTDAQPRIEGSCTDRAARGGAFDKPSSSMRPYVRAHFPPASRLDMLGFRIARDA